MMKKMLSLFLAGIMVAGLLTGCGSKTDTPAVETTGTAVKEPVELVCSHIFGADTIQNKACQMFAQKLEEKTGGAYKMTIYPAAKLGNMNDIL